MDTSFWVPIESFHEKIGAKIREGRHALVPNLAVVGAKEMENDTLAVRSRKDGELGEIATAEFVERVVGEVRERRL